MNICNFCRWDIPSERNSDCTYACAQTYVLISIKIGHCHQNSVRQLISCFFFVFYRGTANQVWAELRRTYVPQRIWRRRRLAHTLRTVPWCKWTIPYYLTICFPSFSRSLTLFYAPPWAGNVIWWFSPLPQQKRDMFVLILCYEKYKNMRFVFFAGAFTYYFY